MTWKEKLALLEHSKQWDEAIAFMEETITNNPNNMDAYIFMNYLLMNLLVEEYTRDKSKDRKHEILAKKYFQISYDKFHNNPEYLYITGRTAVMAEMVWGIQVKDYRAMFKKALYLEPDNLVYQEQYFWTIEDIDPLNPALIAYAEAVLTEPSPVTEQLNTKGAAGEYLLELKRGVAEDILRRAEYLKQEKVSSKELH